MCFEELVGSRGLFLSCGHFGCRECLSQMAQLHTAEADVAALRCPVADCRQPFASDVLEKLLGAGLRPCFERVLELFGSLSGLETGRQVARKGSQQAIRCAAQRSAA